MRSAVVFCLVLCASSIRSDSILAKCRFSDAKCLSSSFAKALPTIFGGLVDRGVESSDPLYIELVDDTTTPELTAKWIKSTIKGYKDCKAENIKFNAQNAVLSHDLVCSLDLSGDYVLNGKLLGATVEGDGKYNAVAKKILLRADAQTEQIDGSGGKKYLQLRDFKLEVQALDKVIFRFQNLFNGDKEKSDAVHKFGDENYKDIVGALGPAFFRANLQKIYENANKFFLTVPVDEFLSFE